MALGRGATKTPTHLVRTRTRQSPHYSAHRKLYGRNDFWFACVHGEEARVVPPRIITGTGTCVRLRRRMDNLESVEVPVRMRIGSKEIGPSLFFSAEEGQANLGDFQMALTMVDIAADAGVDAIEFQLARAADFYVASHPGDEKYAKREFSDAQHRALVERAHHRGIAFIAAPLSHKLIPSLRQVGCDAFDINASDLTNPDIIDAVVASDLPFFLSVPMATHEEIRWAIDRIRRDQQRAVFALAHGQHTMASAGGVPVAGTTLGYLTTLANTYHVPVGFIDHTSHAWMPSVAVAAGAVFVSKHLARSRDAH